WTGRRPGYSGHGPPVVWPPLSRLSPAAGPHSLTSFAPRPGVGLRRPSHVPSDSAPAAAGHERTVSDSIPGPPSRLDFLPRPDGVVLATFLGCPILSGTTLGPEPDLR